MIKDRVHGVGARIFVTECVYRCPSPHSANGCFSLICIVDNGVTSASLKGPPGKKTGWKEIKEIAKKRDHPVNLMLLWSPHIQKQYTNLFLTHTGKTQHYY
jgi:hypothetical protein